MSGAKTKKEKNEVLIIKFKDLVNRDVQKNDLQKTNESNYDVLTYANTMKIAEKSFFRVVYNHACEQISMIVKQNSMIVKQNLNPDDMYDIQNIIAFTGRRGTGKTSAMISLVNFFEGNYFQFDTNQAASKFRHLITIDASHLSENESILSFILTEIIDSLDKRLENKHISYKEICYQNIKNLQERARKLLSQYFENYTNSKRNYDSPYSMEKGISDKLNIEKKFRKIINDYSKLSSESEHTITPSTRSFFVICIDDIDMASCGHIEIMKCIHKYLMIPNVIVMITTDLSFLIPQIQKIYYDNICPDPETQIIQNISLEQTQELLKKMLPSDNRIAMPSWKKKDYTEMFPIKIDFGNKTSDFNQFSGDFPKLNNSEFCNFMQQSDDGINYMITPKELILMMISNRTKIYLDVQGYKYHFMEPVSLRNMYDLFYLLYNMNNIIDEYEDRRMNTSLYYLHRSENRKRLLDYIHFTMRDDMCFSTEENRFFSSLLAQPIERRGKMIWEHYFTSLRTENNESRIKSLYDKYFYEDETSRHSNKNYSFGELFRILYISTRIGIFDSKFVKFILATFSFALPAFVENEKYIVTSGHDKEYDYKRLVDNFGRTFLGTWCEDLFGRRSNSKMDTIEVNKCYIQIDRCRLKSTNIKSSVKSLLYLLLLCPHSDDDTILVENEHDNNKTNIYIDLDPTAFFMNVLLIKHRINKPMFIFSGDTEKITAIQLIESLLQDMQKEESVKEIIGTFAEDGVEEKSGIAIELSKNYKEFHISNVFKHMDLMYNVIKRAASKLIYINPNDITQKGTITDLSNPEKIIGEFYDNILLKLEKNDNVYFSQKNSEIKFSYRLKNNPIIQFFLDDNSKFKLHDESFLRYSDTSEAGINLMLNAGRIGNLTSLEYIFSELRTGAATISYGIIYIEKIITVLSPYSGFLLNPEQIKFVTDTITSSLFSLQGYEDYFTGSGDNSANFIEVFVPNFIKKADNDINIIKEYLNLR